MNESNTLEESGFRTTTNCWGWTNLECNRACRGKAVPFEAFVVRDYSQHILVSPPGGRKGGDPVYFGWGRHTTLVL